MRMSEDIDLYKREIAREKAARKEAERLLEVRARELYDRHMALQTEMQIRQQAEEALRIQAEALANTNRELEQFAYIVSHDLQAPLRGITGFTKLLARSLERSQKLDDETREYVGFIDDGTKRMSQLIQDVLALSRTGRKALATEAVPLSKPVQTVLHTLKGSIEAKAARVEVSLMHTVLGDANLLTQLFQNLIENAIKYGATHVLVSSQDLNGLVEVRVQDNGIGIAPEDLERIFAIFQRLHGEDSEYEGTGIGLAICKKIVDRHHGKIWAESLGLGQGTSLCVLLPAA